MVDMFISSFVPFYLSSCFANHKTLALEPPRLKDKLDKTSNELADFNEQLMEIHGEGVIDGFTHEWLP